MSLFVELDTTNLAGMYYQTQHFCYQNWQKKLIQIAYANDLH